MPLRLLTLALSLRGTLSLALAFSLAFALALAFALWSLLICVLCGVGVFGGIDVLDIALAVWDASASMAVPAHLWCACGWRCSGSSGAFEASGAGKSSRRTSGALDY